MKLRLNLSLRTKIMEALISGPATSKVLYEQVKAYAASWDSFIQTLAKLRTDGLVQSKRYGTSELHTGNSLYALTTAGAVDLIEADQHYKIDEIRTSLLGANTVAHELGVAGVVKTLRWEMVEFPYSADYFDDAACRRLRKHLGLTGWVPDILLKFTSIRYQPSKLLTTIELDFGSRSLADVLQAILLRDCPTLFLCNTTKRLHDLRKELASYDHLHGRIHFALLSDFCSRPGGVFSTDWINLRGDLISLYPKM